MIQAQPLATSHILDERDAQISGSLDYVASFLERPSPKQKTGPVASACLADIVSLLNQGNRDAAIESFQLIDDAPAPRAATCTSWTSDYFSKAVWQKITTIFDTDRDVAFNPAPASPSSKAFFQDRFDTVRELLAKYCSDALDEFDRIVTLIFLGEPKENSFHFDGGSTFFCPEAILINSAPRRSVAQTLEVVLHEASHLFLFGYAGSDGLSKNDPHARYKSPLRDEPRPMEGIFHAAFVTSRVHWIIGEILKANDLPDPLRTDLEDEYVRLEEAAKSSLMVLSEHCEPTEKGQTVLAALTEYWS